MGRPLLLVALIWGSAALAGPLPEPVAIYPEPDMTEVRLGRLLFFDPILSGNGSVACASCHHPRFGTSDGLSLGLGDGGIGLGPERRADPANPPERRIGRNAPALFNLGASEFSVFFHDGRLEADPDLPGGMRTPLDGDMTAGFDSALAAQAMFPVLSPDEMAGHYAENDVAKAVRQGRLTGEGGAWDILSARVAAIEAYRDGFESLGIDRIQFTDIANAIAAFVAFEFRADDSPFDAYLRGTADLTQPVAAGMELFYGEAGCSTCHAGLFQTDHGFHAIAMPQIGPGKAARFERHQQDRGRFRVTGHPADAYRFRTPSLRNVALTAPYGHAGTYATLEAAIRHHLDPIAALQAYDPGQAVLPEIAGIADTDFAVARDAEARGWIGAANELAPSTLSDAQIADLVAFLEALTDPVSRIGRLGVPASVPSGLPVDQ